MDNLNIEIKIKLLNLENVEPISKKFIYHYDAEKEYTDTIEFTSNKIKIIGNRKKAIDAHTYLNTRKSRGYRECVSCLIYMYNKFGNFLVEEIKINDYKIPTFNQKFLEEASITVKNEEMLDLLFDYRENRVYLPLMHVIEGLNNSEYKLEHAWKAFNHIYNTVCQNNNDRDSYMEVYNKMSKSEVKYKEVFDNAKQKFKEVSIDRGKAISFMCKNSPDQLNKVASFVNIFNIGEITDEHLLCTMQQIFEEVYIKLHKDYTKNSSQGNYEIPDTKYYAETLKIFKKQLKKSGVEDKDYLKFLLDYMYYLRNKSMHGVFQSPSFLFENEHTNELTRYGSLISDMCILLIQNNIFHDFAITG